MPSFTSFKTPSLALVGLGKNTISGPTLPEERRISRLALVEISPDREALLTSSRSIEEIRETLKIRTVASLEGQWLYENLPKPMDGNTTKIDGLRATPALRRCFSSSSIYPLTSSGMDGALLEAARTSGRSKLLSTKTKLISPRPLGATHILVLYEASSSDEKFMGPAVEVPINDLVFVLNTPHLANPHDIPHRRQGELPRVPLKVRHLETFPELVVYLHNKNQAELFRAVIPEWIRDVIHPIAPFLAQPSADRGRSATPKRAFGRRSPSPAPLPSILAVLSCSRSRSRGERRSHVVHTVERTVDSVAYEIADTDIRYSDTHYDSDSDVAPSLMSASKSLNLLRDNMEDVGLYTPDLWAELNAYTTILQRAVGLQARMFAEED
ncbi:hypothetical protein PLICRDRAFT_28186 [Plicaturopsis crispa FD-325 SS-3]|nr:hypothetical protein PLICRDRAFT_28186 [Plicaturopsis crispa FD-325 SS-3]